MAALTGDKIPQMPGPVLRADRHRRHQGEPVERPRHGHLDSLLREVISALNAVGVPNRNMIVYDRNSNQLEVNGYHTRSSSGVRVIGLDQRWSVKGSSDQPCGYDPDVYCEMDCFGERETRSTWPAS